MNDIFAMGSIFWTAIFLGIVKYGSIASKYKDSSRYLKFMELWNCFINYFIPGLISYCFIKVRWTTLLNGEALCTSDLILFLIFILGLFGHLNVMSKNITDGVQAIISRGLEGR